MLIKSFVIGFIIMSSVEFEDDIEFRVTTVFAPSDLGTFAIFPNEDCYFNSYWDTCREQFAKKFLKKSYGFFLSVNPDVIWSSPRFIQDCEKVLQLRNKSRFYRTDMKNVVFIIPSKFWMRCYMRRSLYTILCRLGLMYHLGPRFEDLLLGNIDETKREKLDATLIFARNTENAILRFFAGFCSYIGSGPNYDEYFPEKHGWVAEFDGKGREFVKSVLVNKKIEKFKLNYFDRSIFLS